MPRGLADKTRQLINWCKAELAIIQSAGVRAVAYQLLSHGRLASMAEVKRVERALGIAREHGIIPWEWVVDDTRTIECEPAWDNPQEFVESITGQYRKNRWARQTYRVFIVCEKNTIRGSIMPVVEAYGVEFLPMHGFSSKTKAHDLAVLSQHSKQPIFVLYLGDHDPSGMQMCEVDLPKRLNRYGQQRMLLKRIAITRAQINAAGLTNQAIAAKPEDPRYPWYVARYGRDCWELDALNPNTLRHVLEDEIVALIDAAAWNHDAAVEKVEAESLTTVLTEWQSILNRGQE
jgi:hypothetical protein